MKIGPKIGAEENSDLSLAIAAGVDVKRLSLAIDAVNLIVEAAAFESTTNPYSDYMSALARSDLTLAIDVVVAGERPTR